MFPLGAIIPARIPAEPESERQLLIEKHRALQTLVHCERGIAKLRMYVRELDLVSAELQETADTPGQRKNAKILPFAPKKPLRSA
jgi:hypothetical protein